MTVTSTKLIRTAGLAAAAAGAIFIAVQISHPPMTVASVSTTDWVVRNASKAVMCVLALVGITGMYLRQVREMRLLGLIGLVTFGLGYLLMFGTEVIATFVLPNLVHSSPHAVGNMVTAAFGGKPAGSIGSLQTYFNLSGFGYIVGGLLFGIALVRAGVLARWAGVLLAVATTATATLAVLPSSFNRPMAVPEGVAMIGLGISLWRERRHPVTAVALPALTTDYAAA